MCITCVDALDLLQEIAAVNDVMQLHGFADDLFGFGRQGSFFAKLPRFLWFLFRCGPVATARGTDTRGPMIVQFLEDFAGVTFSDSNMVEVSVITQAAD